MFDSSMSHAVLPLLLPVTSADCTGGGVRIITEEMQFEKLLVAGMALSAELRRIWGKDAFSARFDDRCRSTSLLCQLLDAYCAEKELYMKILSANRDPLPRFQGRQQIITARTFQRKAA